MKPSSAIVSSSAEAYSPVRWGDMAETSRPIYPFGPTSVKFDLAVGNEAVRPNLRDISHAGSRRWPPRHACGSRLLKARPLRHHWLVSTEDRVCCSPPIGRHCGGHRACNSAGKFGCGVSRIPEFPRQSRSGNGVVPESRIGSPLEQVHVGGSLAAHRRRAGDPDPPRDCQALQLPAQPRCQIPCRSPARRHPGDRTSSSRRPGPSSAPRLATSRSRRRSTGRRSPQEPAVVIRVNRRMNVQHRRQEPWEFPDPNSKASRTMAAPPRRICSSRRLPRGTGSDSAMALRWTSSSRGRTAGWRGRNAADPAAA